MTGLEIDRMNVTVAGVLVTHYYGTNSVPMGTTVEFTALDIGAPPLNTSFTWSIFPSYGASIVSTYGPHDCYASIYFSSAGLGTIFTITAEISTPNCGLLSGFKNVFVTRGGSNGIFYPNPVSDILYVDLDKIANVQNKTAITFDISLYDSFGNLVSKEIAKGGIVEINVSKQPDGVYLLHINNGISQTPDVYKIIVKH